MLFCILQQLLLLVFIQDPISIRVDCVDCVDLFFHDMTFSLCCENFGNERQISEKQKVTEEEMCLFVGIMFAMTVSPASNIKQYWSADDDGLKVAQRRSSIFQEIAHALQSVQLHSAKLVHCCCASRIKNF